MEDQEGKEGICIYKGTRYVLALAGKAIVSAQEGRGLKMKGIVIKE